jgi:hypothetical protein
MNIMKISETLAGGLENSCFGFCKQTALKMRFGNNAPRTAKSLGCYR